MRAEAESDELNTYGVKRKKKKKDVLNTSLCSTPEADMKESWGLKGSRSGTGFRPEDTSRVTFGTKRAESGGK